MLIPALVLTFSLQIALPFLLGWWFSRHMGAGWRVFWVGVLTFLGSQIVHIPLLLGLTALFKGINLPESITAAGWINPVILGLAAGVCEETARWVGFKLLKKRAQPFSSGLMLGAGHGGLESIMVGLSVAGTFVLMLIGGRSGANLPPALAPLAGQVVAGWVSAPVDVLASLVERIAALSLQVSLSVMVWTAVVKRKAVWFWLAIFWHAVVDAAAVYMVQPLGWGTWSIEAVITGMAVLSLLLVLYLWKRHGKAEPTPEHITDHTIN